MKQAECARFVSLQVHLRHLFDSWHVRAKHIFDRAKKFETPFPGGREDRGDDIEIPMIRGPRLSEYSVTVELGARGRVVASVIKLLIRFLRSVVRKRLTAYLPSA